MSVLDEQLNGRFAAQQIQGERPYQEADYGLIEPPDEDRSEVLLLADGMGGHVSGDTASSTIVRTFLETYPDEGPIPDRLRTCLNAANDALAAAIAENLALKGMGSTVVAAVISARGLDWISVGDSPLWLFREGELRRLNADHSMAPVLADLVAVGRMTAEEAATDSQRHALRSAVMGDEIHLVDVSAQPVEIRQSDRVLLASDGLMTLPDEQIAGILQERQEAPLAEVVAALIQAVEAAGHPRQDNTTVLLYTPATDSEPTADSEIVVDSETAADSETAVDSEPVTDSETAADSEPTADSVPTVDSVPVADSEPTADSEPAPDSGPETAPASGPEPAAADTTAQAEPEPGKTTAPPTSASAVTEDTPQAEPEPNKATAPLSLTRGWLGIALSIGFLLGFGLLGWWFLSGMQAGDVAVEPTPEPQEPAEQAGTQSPPSAVAPKDSPPPAPSDSVQTSEEGASNTEMAEPDQPPEAQADSSLIPAPSQPDSGQASGEASSSAGTPLGLQADSTLTPASMQPDSGQASGEAPQEKAVEEDASPKPSVPSDTTAQ